MDSFMISFSFSPTFSHSYTHLCIYLFIYLYIQEICKICKLIKAWSFKFVIILYIIYTYNILSFIHSKVHIHIQRPYDIERIKLKVKWSNHFCLPGEYISYYKERVSPIYSLVASGNFHLWKFICILILPLKWWDINM